MKQIVFSILSVSLLLSSCSKDNECELSPDHTLTPVNFSSSLMDIQQSRAIKATWAPNDQMAIFSDIAVKKDGTTSTSPITYTRGAQEGVWTAPSEDEQWYFTDAVRQYNFYSYYPMGSATSYAAVEIPDISGQDGTKTLDNLKTEHDFMRGAATATSAMITANLQMFRVFSIINLQVKLKQDAFTDNMATLTDVKLISVNSLPLVNPTSATKATVNLSNGSVACATGLTTTTLHPTSGFALTPSQLDIPVIIYPQHSAINVQFTIGGKTSPVLPLGTTANFVGGRIYNYSVEIDADIQVIQINDPIILDWINVPAPSTPITPFIPN